MSVNVKNAEVKSVLKAIEKSSKYRFLYNYELKGLKNRVDFRAEEASLENTLNKLLDANGLTYKMVSKNLIAVVSKDPEENAEIRITGKVTSQAGDPVSGASVQEKGTSNGTITNNNGEYTLTVGNNAVLQISAIGYQSQEVPVAGKNIVDVQLVAAVTQMDQVVVIGYGTQTKKDLTGAVSVISEKDIKDRPLVNAAEALQGKASGVSVVSNSGKPGAGLSIRVRGSSSISAGNDPLYVVDGVPMTDISSFSATDIASISILKDAASTAIYGTRAANGVVIITTKKGSGKGKLDANVYYGISRPTKMLSVLNARQYQAYANQLTPGLITDSAVNATNINWPKEVIGNGHQENYQLTYSKGGKVLQSFVSLNYLNQTGIIEPAKFNRFTARGNFNIIATKWLTINWNNIYTYDYTNDVTDNQSVARGGVVLSALETPPIIPKFNPDGTIGFNPYGNNWENPLGAILGQYNRTYANRLVSNLGINIKIGKNLTFDSKFAIDYLDQKYNHFLDPFLTTYGRQTRGQTNQTKTKNPVWLNEETLNFTKTWNSKHHFSALGGWTVQKSYKRDSVRSGSVLDPSLNYNDYTWEAIYQMDSIKNPSVRNIDEWGLISMLGRVMYDYEGKYLFQANIRSDQSSKFAKGYRTATFPSFSAGWRISEEPFMKDSKIFSDLKLRVSWGKNGNQEGIGSYSYLNTSTVDPVTGGLTINNIAPQNLTWETTTQSNIGLDAGFFNNRLSFTGDFYVKKTKNILVNIPVSSQVVAVVPVNAGAMQNTGAEFLLSSKNIAGKDFTWNTDFNISFNRNKVTEIGLGINTLNVFGGIYERDNAITLRTGYGLGEFYMYRAAGVDPQTGLQLYYTKDGQTTSNPAPSDRALVGSAQPDFLYGLNNTFSYKNFDLVIFLQGSQGNKIFNAGRLELESMRNAINQSSAILNRWMNPGDVTDIPAVSINQSTANTLTSTRFLENGSYLRFKTITLSYRVGPKVLSSLGLRAASIYVSCNNLITFTKYKGFDPEVSSYGSPTNTTDNRNISIGIDNGAYPQTKMVLLGVNIGIL
ncbi:hypothetical protein A8C56_22705 [Niabella ginsenosidivorans]|uniref:TonB-dependent receptor plug domain-containing protein n=1 Tax=Niabella ginsenosidivorans TaxID=1176587 RepID=A0A1A9I9W0_9BACT|nr:hypothetical protein A8C56_22705 [Niabella ginsenosidivorans]